MSLTTEGEEVIKKALPEHIKRVEDAFSVLIETEQEDLINLLKKFKTL